MDDMIKVGRATALNTVLSTLYVIAIDLYRDLVLAHRPEYRAFLFGERNQVLPL
jgi:hypothetical protein